MTPETELKAIVGDEALVNEKCEDFAVDGKIPRWIAYPATPEEVSQLMTVALTNDYKVVPYGEGRYMSLGRIPDRIDLIISSRRLTEVNYYNHKDMTISIGAGIILSSLAKHIKADNLWFPVNPSHPDEITIGGVVSANINGPLRFAKGALRDHIIGIKVVSPDGRIVHAGGKVVKNVAGYDMCKLYTGSLGTLGMIVEVSLKLASLPEAQSALWAKVDGGDRTEELIDSIMDSSVDPIYLELITGERAQTISRDILNCDEFAPAILALGFDGGKTKVKWQSETAGKKIAQAGFDVIRVQYDQNAMNDWQVVADNYDEQHADMVLKGTILSSQVTEFIKYAHSLAEHRQCRIGCSAHAGNGIVSIYLNGEDSNLVSIAADSLNYVGEIGGNLIVHKAPVHLKPYLSIWGNPSDGWKIMQEIRNKFDPSEIINPARFITAA